MSTVAELAQQYVSIHDTIDQLSAEADDVKKAMEAQYAYTEGDGAQPILDCGEGVKTQWIKGRHTVKVDAAKARKALLLKGVPVDVVEKAFADATSESTGKPGLRVWRG